MFDTSSNGAFTPNVKRIFRAGRLHTKSMQRREQARICAGRREWRDWCGIRSSWNISTLVWAFGLNTALCFECLSCPLVFDDLCLPELTFLCMKMSTYLCSKCLWNICIDVFVCCCSSSKSLRRESARLFLIVDVLLSTLFKCVENSSLAD